MLQLQLEVHMKKMHVKYKNRREFYCQQVEQVKEKRSMKAQAKKVSKRK